MESYSSNEFIPTKVRGYNTSQAEADANLMKKLRGHWLSVGASLSGALFHDSGETI